MRLITERNQGFSWHHRGGVHAKGYLFDRAGIFRQGEATLDYFGTASDADSFREKLREANGCFALILETDRQLLAAVDPVRSMPLFHATNGGCVVLGDDVRAIQQEFEGEAQIDPVAREELLRVGYTVGPSTLDPRIKQLEAGEMFVVDKATARGRAEVYFSHAHGDYTNKGEESLIDELDEITTRWARRLIASSGGRTIVVPLSGGYDSRSIVCALRRENYPNVICCSYGVPTSYEHHIARKVAARLGYGIHIVEYNRQRWESLIESSLLSKFCRFALQQCAVPSVQEILTLETLAAERAVPADSIFVPGYCGDLLGGSYVPFETGNNHSEAVLVEGIDNYLYRRLFTNWRKPIMPETKQAILDRIHDYTSRFKADDIQSFCSVLEDWFTRHKVAKFVINAVRTYEFFGHEWRLPLWDKELIAWWYRIPLRFRVNSVLYHRYLFDRLFNPMGVGFRKPWILDSLRRSVRPRLPARLARFLRRFYVSTIGRIQPNSLDVDAFEELSSLLLDRVLLGVDRRGFGNVNGAVAAWCLCNSG